MATRDLLDKPDFQVGQTVEVTGTVDTVYYETDSGFRVIKIETENRGSIKAVGDTIIPVSAGDPIKVAGTVSEHEDYGLQITVDESEPHTPQTLDGIESYLASDFIEGVGPAYAEKIVDAFGENTLDVIEETPEKLRQIDGIGEKRLTTITESYESHRDARDTMIDLKSFGITTTNAMKLYEHYEENATAILKEDPYRLIDNIHGIGFKKADTIARKVGLPADHPDRFDAAVKHVLSEAESSDGDLYVPYPELVGRTVDCLYDGLDGDTATSSLAGGGSIPPAFESAVDQIDESLERLSQADDIKREPLEEDGVVLYYRALTHRVEQRLANNIRSNADTVADWDHPTLDESTLGADVNYNDQQLRAIRTVLSGESLILTGGPGTGKTTTVRAIIEAADRMNRTVQQAAPTGRAAQILAKSTDHEAKTIHRLLEFNPREQAFDRNENNPIDTDILVIDEVSMVDVFLANHLMKAVPDDTACLFLGDPDQLPSVGPGQVLDDLIEADKLDVVELTQIYRQGETSSIIVNAHKINEGYIPAIDEEIPVKDRDYHQVNHEDAESVHETVLNTVTTELTNEGYDPITDIQVLTSQHDRSDGWDACGLESLNADLQWHLNDRVTEDRDQKMRGFHVNDKVIQTRNNYDKTVFNGNVGMIQSEQTIDDTDGVMVRYPVLGRTVFYTLDEAYEQLQLAYGITIHKSQGSEYPVVVLPLVLRHWTMLRRNLLYTALTRATEKVVLVNEARNDGNKNALMMAVKTDNGVNRNSRLAERLSANGGSTLDCPF